MTAPASPPLTLNELAELRRLHEEATPAPWPEEYVQGAVRHVARNMDNETFCNVPADRFQWDRYRDGPFITAARNHFARLLLAAERAEGLATAMERVLALRGWSTEHERISVREEAFRALAAYRGSAGGGTTRRPRSPRRRT